MVEQSVPVTLSGSVAERLRFIIRVQNIEVDQLYPPAQPFADSFTGLGELKLYEYDIKIKPGAVVSYRFEQSPWPWRTRLERNCSGWRIKAS